MKLIRLVATLFISCCFATAAFAAPELAVDQPLYDFGSVVQGKKIDHVFTFRNKGDTPLTVVRTRTSCGCTVASVSSKNLAPGATGEVRITFDSSTFNGKISKQVYLETNDPRKPVFTLTLNGTVAEEIVVNPRQLNFGTVKPGVSKELVVSIENQGAKPVKLTSVKSPVPQVSIKQGKTQLKPGESTKLTVTVTPRAEDRFLSGYLTITTDNPNRSEIMVPIYGSLAR
jgi:uncharacterized cupredoxin-like copper-binding protein